MRAFRILLVLIGLFVLLAVALRVTHPLPDRSGIEHSVAMAPTTTTRLGAAKLSAAAGRPDLSGVAALADGREALAARALLARAAEASIDVRYYIWQADTTGWLLLHEMHAAAERGVRVRFLLDDNGVPGLDNVLSALDAHPNIEVRLFNPFTLRRPKVLSWVFDFPRLNRRMHNKSMTVDGAVSIVGGRNIGDIYFAYGDGPAYVDLDVLAVGPIAEDTSRDFDRYWASASAYPAGLLLSPAEDGLAELAASAVAARQSLLGSEYLEAIDRSPLVAQVLAGEDILEWTEVTIVSDDPAKGLGRIEREGLLLGQMQALLPQAESRVDLVSAYLVPGTVGTELLADLARSGVAVRLVTNALEATDVLPVHSGWIRYRPQLLEAGVTILELRARPGWAQGQGIAELFAGSSASLHAKTLAVDEARIFIGSFNFDPRAAALNTEMGVLIESPAIAAELTRRLDRQDAVYEVRRAADGSLRWLEARETGEVIEHRTEPNAGIVQRGLVRFLSWLPIERLL